MTLISSIPGVQSVQRRPMSTHAPTVIRRFVPFNEFISLKFLLVFRYATHARMRTTTS